MLEYRTRRLTKRPFVGQFHVAHRVLFMPTMMSNETDLHRVVREVTEQFLIGDAPVLAGELIDALLVASARVGQLRRNLDEQAIPVPRDRPVGGDLQAIDDAFGRSIDLARRLSHAVRTNRAPGAYAAVASIARELGRQLAPAMPETMRLALRCPTGPVIAMIPPADLRWLLAVLVQHVVEEVGNGGDLALEVTESTARERAVRVVVGHARLRAAAAAEAADQVRDLVHAWGGSVDPCARSGGGAAIVVLVPSAC